MCTITANSVIKYVRYLFLCLLAALLTNCNNQKPQIGAAVLPPVVELPKTELPLHLAATLADYDRYFTDSMRLTQTPGAAVVVVKDSQIVFCKGYGHRSAGLPEKVDEHTVFRIGSLSKGFASVLTGTLVQDSILQWNDRVSDWYPGFTLSDKAQTRRMKLTHILSHTTGLPYHAFTNLIEMGFDVPTINTYFPRLKMTAKEGQMYAYQNAAYSVIEEVIRGVTRQSYQQLLSERLLIPAGLSDASLSYVSLMSVENKALPHVYNGVSWIPGQITPYYYNTCAAGGVNASATDMGQWLKVLLGHRPDLVSDSTLEQVFTPRIRTYGERRYFGSWPGKKEAYYALGWRVLRWQDDTIIAHSGSVNGFYGQIAIDRKSGVGICVLFNAMTDLTHGCVSAFFERYKRLQGT
jgi:beta-lactamase class C